MLTGTGLFTAVAALAGVSALLGASLYDAVVLAPNLQADPQGLEHGRLFLSRATPANLFRVLAPLTQLLLLVAAISAWASIPDRWLVVAAFLAIVACDVITFAYHYPRNRLLFTSPLNVAPEALRAAARQWRAANLVRVLLILLSWSLLLIALIGSR